MTNYISRTGAQRPNGAPHFEGDVVDVDAIVGTTTVMCFFFLHKQKGNHSALLFTRNG